MIAHQAGEVFGVTAAQPEYPTTIGFISLYPNLDKEIDKGNLPAKPIGFALVQITGDDYSGIIVHEMIELDMDRSKLITGIFDIAEKRQLPVVYCDHREGEKNYIWLNGDRAWHNERRRREASRPSRIEYPRLTPTVRKDGIAVRQMDALNPLFAAKILFFSDRLIAEGKSQSALQQVGKSASLDALAGACEIAEKNRRRLRERYLADKATKRAFR